MVLPVQVIIFTRNNWIKSLCPPFSLQSVTGSATNHGCPVEDSPCLRSTCAGRRPCSMDSSPTVLASGLELFMCGENVCENICENVCSVINSPIQCCCHCCCFCVANVAVPPIPLSPLPSFPPRFSSGLVFGVVSMLGSVVLLIRTLQQTITQMTTNNPGAGGQQALQVVVSSTRSVLTPTAELQNDTLSGLKGSALVEDSLFSSSCPWLMSHHWGLNMWSQSPDWTTSNMSRLKFVWKE